MWTWKKDCCCQWLLFTQPDFVNQKSHLEELIAFHSHVCDFYPEYHCELNFIEQYWGMAKLCYHSSSKTNDIERMEENMETCLDNIPVIQIRRSTSFLPSLSHVNYLVCHSHQIYKQISSIYQCLLTGSVRPWGCMGKPEIPWSSHSSIQYSCRFEARILWEAWWHHCIRVLVM